MKIRNLMRTLAASAAVLGCVGAAAQGFPSKPIRVVVCVAPGGSGDAIGRIVGAGLGNMGQPVVVENRPGAGGTLAGAFVAKGPADGHALLVCDPTPAVAAVAMYKQLTYDPPRDLAMVQWAAAAQFWLVTSSASGITSMKALIEQAKANPGKISYGNSGAGTMHHLTVELLKQRLGIDMVPVFYKGGGPSVQDVAGNQIPVVLSGPASTEGLIKSGKLRLLAVASRERSPAHPDVPAFSEFVPGFEANSPLGVWAAAGTPRDILVRLNSELNKAVQQPAVLKQLQALGLDSMPIRDLAESDRVWREQLGVWPDLIRKLKLTAD